MVELQQLLESVIEKKASDLHITTGSPPQFRINGSLTTFDSVALTATDTKRLCYSVLTDAQRHKFEEDWELDIGFLLWSKRTEPIQRKRLYATGSGGRSLPGHLL